MYFYAKEENYAKKNISAYTKRYEMEFYLKQTPYYILRELAAFVFEI